jgi:hypothetical protein
MLDVDFGDLATDVLLRTPPYLLSMSSKCISWMTPKGAEDGSRTPRHRRWLWKNRPSVPLEIPTAHRDQRLESRYG